MSECGGLSSKSALRLLQLKKKTKKKTKILVVTAEEHSDFFTQDLLLACNKGLEGKLAGLHIFSLNRHTIGPG